MKKILSVLALTGAVVSSANAATNIQTGFYIGANVGAHASKLRDYKVDGKNTNGHGSNGITGSLFAGYGFVNCNWYFGGELGLHLENHNYKLNLKDFALGGGVAFTENDVYNIKRNFFGSVAARIGYLVTPSTMIYARAGLELGKWKITNQNTYDDLLAGTTTVTTTRSNKNLLAFAPGFGLETALANNVTMRTEWVCQINKKTSQSLNIRPTSHRFTVGLSYRF